MLAPTSTNSDRPTSPAHPIRTLVVDDNELVRRTVQLRLRKLGHEVRLADSGEAAFCMANEEEFDLIVTDVSMGRVSGVHLTRMLRSAENTESLPIVLLTAEDDPRGRFWGRNAGADAYVSKASMHTDLLPAIDRVLAGGGAAPGIFRPVGPQSGVRSPSPDPLDRMTEVLDRQLFAAVVMSQAQHLIAQIEDEEAFFYAALDLIGDVITSPYVHLQVYGHRAASSGLVARGPFPVPASAVQLATLALPVGFDPVAIRHIDDPRYADQPITAGERVSFPIVVGEEELGQLAVYGGSRRIAREDRNTATVLANSLAPVLKSMRLLNDTKRMATTDALTGLNNRRQVSARLAEELERAERYGNPLGVIILDIDHFKSVNDTYGHNVGDDVLRKLASTLHESVRSIDLTARWGGEEFLVVLPETLTEDAMIVGERIRAAIEAMPPFEDGPPRVTASLGLAISRPSDTTDSIVERADGALYEAKHGGRNRLLVAS